MKYSVYMQTLVKPSDRYYDFYGRDREYWFFPWTLVSTVDGAFELYYRFSSHHFYWTDTMEDIVPADAPLDVYKAPALTRALVKDEDGRILDFHELTDCFCHLNDAHDKHYKESVCYGWNADIPNRTRKAMTRPEVDDFLAHYHLPVPDVKGARVFEPFWIHKPNRKSWKVKTKKQRQYGRHSEKLSQLLFEHECDKAEAEMMEM